MFSSVIFNLRSPICFKLNPMIQKTNKNVFNYKNDYAALCWNWYNTTPTLTKNFKKQTKPRLKWLTFKIVINGLKTQKILYLIFVWKLKKMKNKIWRFEKSQLNYKNLSFSSMKTKQHHTFFYTLMDFLLKLLHFLFLPASHIPHFPKIQPLSHNSVFFVTWRDHICVSKIVIPKLNTFCFIVEEDAEGDLALKSPGCIQWTTTLIVKHHQFSIIKFCPEKVSLFSGIP